MKYPFIRKSVISSMGFFVSLRMTGIPNKKHTAAANAAAVIRFIG